MGESTCLMQPFSYAAGIPNDAHEGNPIHALGQSVSFGRFVSESLAWEKWSTFSHNRYVEEAERYARPGSVAQKKAFFEAHYKKVAAQRAAALLEQANANATAAATSENAPEPKSESRDLKTRISTSEVFVDEQKEEKVEEKVYEPNREEESIGKYTNDYNANTEMEKFESSKVHPVDHEDQVSGENSVEVELSSQCADKDKEENGMELTGAPQIEKPLLKQSYRSNHEALTPVKTKKNRLFSSSKSSLAYHKAPKVPSSPAKPTAPSCSRKDDIITPLRKYPAAELEDKKKSTPKSLHKSVKFTPIRELSRLTSTVMRKIENSRVGASSSKTSKECLTPLKTPTTVSRNEVHKRSTTTPCSEKRRAKTPLDPSASGTKTPVSKWRLLRTDCSKFLSACRNKARSPFSSAPIALRTEERAASRKKKLEEKFNANEERKVQVQRKLKEEEETEIGKYRQTLCFKARPLPDFYKERKSPRNEIHKVPVTPQSKNPGKKPTPSTVESSTSLPPSGASIKSIGSKNVLGRNNRTPGRNDRTPTCSLISRSFKTTRENTSPNIQLGQPKLENKFLLEQK
ncbi:protein WVD2-like 7 isoform X1 [Pyrus x bretschneideri]|uniref:protein WVD2-like 7 isoform X1 n=1 Tax=Pyrus x bretschneideri TaxID=225117 RepID=UPI00202FA044|nr:protein WVD2-like 7 isoform X1 [Pyrus x bretschneideri]